LRPRRREDPRLRRLSKFHEEDDWMAIGENVSNFDRHVGVKIDAPYAFYLDAFCASETGLMLLGLI